MSSWSFGFGQSLHVDSQNPATEAQRSPHNASEMIDKSQRGRRNKKLAFETNVPDLNDALPSRDMAEPRGSVFCTKDNLLNSIAYINQELELLGFPCLKFEGGKCTADMYFYINRLHDLLVLYHKTTSVKEDLETKNHQLSCDTNHHQSTCARLRREQDLLERELAQEKEKSRQINHKYKQLSVKLKTEKEEVKRLLAVMQSRDVQHRHDNKKREREVISLKERLHQLLADKVPDRKVGMDLMNVVSSGEGRRATWKINQGKLEEEMYQLVIANYEERHKELMIENADLRDCLLSLQRHLSGLLKNAKKSTSASDPKLHGTENLSTVSGDDIQDQSLHSHVSVTNIDEGYMQMPFDIVGKDIEKIFKETCDQISDGIKQPLAQNDAKTGQPAIAISNSNGTNSFGKGSREKRASVDALEVERLKKQISNYKDIIQQQEELIQQSLQSQSQSVETSFLHESQLLQEKENLSEQKKLFFEEKSAFEKERRAFTDAAIRLGKERQAFQEERSSILRQQIHSSSSTVKQQPDSKSKDVPHPTRLLPATPMFSPAKVPSKTITQDTPCNLPEPYQAQSLSPDSENQSNLKNTGTSKKKENTFHSVSQKEQQGPVIHYTPCITATPTAAAANSSQSSTPANSEAPRTSGFDSAASLESIKAALVRIRRSAAQSDEP
ncbi:afadin-and alpha-actinin-binding protein [Plakobranchus ocellatus]|uniref:Afadin-and alpha-actinin-binding protein n=1 Tax=Plakobranchus ocellatus TaxID=259542 RepID=A0AAV4AF23_9GAST|nr:afadin-and alpha-actinin-binding protein [Plakobranchus ocellatus]